MYEGLSGEANPLLNERLKDSLKGQELYVLDSENRSGRDFSFELATAAKFVRAGLAVDFGHEADLRVQINGFTFFVECKRLKSAKKIRKRIKEGINQLHKRYVKSENSHTARGMLALSIGKTVNKNLGLLVTVRPSHLVRYSRRPVVGQQLVDGVVLLRRQAGQHILQVSIGIVSVQLC